MSNPTLALSRSTPEAQGISSAAIAAFVADANAQLNSLHSLMIVRHGHVVAEGWWYPYAANEPHVLFSLSKSFTSTAIGLAIAEGLLSLDSRVLDFFPNERPAEVSDYLAAMTVHDLLAMATGHDKDTTGALHEREDGNWVAAFLAQPVTHPPGTHFVYNSGATYMLSAILQTVTGITLLDYLQPRLFQPLGIENPTWESCPRGINVGGWGLSIRTEDIARFGQLYLQEGVWQGKQLVPAEWIAQATAKQVDNDTGHTQNIDWRQGYGYQFWRCRYGAYRGDGAFGQFCVVLPEQQTVIAITSGLSNMQAVLDLVWQHLLPALGPAPLPADPATHAALQQTLAELALAPQAGAPSSPLVPQVNGQTYRFPKNDQGIEAATLTFADSQATVVRTINGQQERFVVMPGSWQKGEANSFRYGAQPAAFSGAWVADDTFALQICFYQTPFIVTEYYRFVENQLQYQLKLNVGFGPTENPVVTGFLEQAA